MSINEDASPSAEAPDADACFLVGLVDLVAFDADAMSATMSVSDRLRGSRGKISPAAGGGGRDALALALAMTLALALAADALLCEAADFLVPPPATAAFCFLAPRVTDAI